MAPRILLYWTRLTMATASPRSRGMTPRPPQRRAEYSYPDELLWQERQTLTRRWWPVFGAAWCVVLILAALGWWQNGLETLEKPEARWYVLDLLLIPLLGAASGYGVWLLWISRRPLRHWETTFPHKSGGAFRAVLAVAAEAGWTPWEIDYDHQILVALAPTGMFEGVPPQVLTIFSSPLEENYSEVRIQSRFIEATRFRDPTRVHLRNLRIFQRLLREMQDRADAPDLPMAHPLARLRGRLPEEQLLAFQALGQPRARARLWVLWVLLTTITAVLLFLQPWASPWIAWPLTFLAAGAFHFLLGSQWNAQERHALSHATATVIANPFPTRAELWMRVDQLAARQRLLLHEILDDDTRLYLERQPANGYPGTYLLLNTVRNDAGVEQLLAVAIPEWGLITALMPQVYTPFQLLAFMQALRRGPEKSAQPVTDRLPSLPVMPVVAELE